jgi:hypothetical protein
VNIGKWLMIAVLTGVAVHLWTTHQRSVFERSVLATADTNGFVAVQMPDGAPPDTALILAALNCPSAAAKRADAMAKRLTEMGIPNRRSGSYSVAAATREQMPLLTRTSIVLQGEIPVIFINGMAKANPTVDEVASEYRRDKQSPGQ